MKKKLLITASTFPRWKGDTEPRFILDYAKAMNRFFDVTVLAPAAIGAKDREILEGVLVERYHYFPIHSLESLCYPGAIISRVKEKKPRALLIPFLFTALFFRLFGKLKNYDIIHAHWLIPQGIVQSFFNKPYIVTGHGSDVRTLNSGVVRRMKKRCIKKAAAVVAVSEDLKEDILKMYPCSKVDIISMGCNVKYFTGISRTENFFNQNGKKVILFVGRLAEVKGVRYLIESMKYLEECMLVIVGAGSLETRLREQAKAYGEQVIFWGSKTHEELLNIYASADVFVTPSVTTENGEKEGFGLVVIEAMASGLPVVASRSGGISNIIEDEVNGLLVEEKDSEGIAKSVKRLLKDDAMREKIVQNGYLTANKYDYDYIAEEYYRLIERSLEENRGKMRDATILF